MLKIKKSLCIFIGAILLWLSAAGCSFTKQVSKSGDRIDKWEKDIDYLQTELPKRHKNLYFKLTKEQFMNKTEQLKKSLKNMDDDQIAIAIRKIIASVGDAHTSSSIATDTLFPVRLYWLKDGFYAVNTSDSYANVKNCKLVKINNKDIDNIRQIIAEIIPHENDAILKSQTPQYLVMPNVLYGLGIISNKDNVTFTFQKKDGKNFDINLKAEKYSDKLVSMLGAPAPSEHEPLYMKNSDKYYWYEYLGDKETFYFKYNQCQNMQDIAFNKFSEDMIKVMNERKPKKVVIDMRNNGGGNSSILDGFIDEISKSEFNKEGHLFVIVGRKTFSSAILNTLSLKNATKAVTVGEPTGGKPNHYGEVRNFKLPNSGITINYSTKYFKYSSEDSDTIVPDKIIELSIDDYINNIDPVMDYILSY